MGLTLSSLTGCDKAREGSEVFLGYGFNAAGSQRLKLDTRVSFAIVHGDREKLMTMSWALVVRLDLLEATDSSAQWGVTIERREISTTGSGGEDENLMENRDGVGASYIGSLRRGLARLLQDERRQLSVDRSGALLDGDRTVFEVLFPLLPHLPARLAARGESFASQARLLLPIVGDVKVEQTGEVAQIAEDPTHRAGLLDIVLEGYQRGDAAGQDVATSLYVIDSVVHSGHDRIRLQAGTGLLEARDLSYQADVHLRVRLGVGGVPVEPARLRVRLNHSARLLR